MSKDLDIVIFGAAGFTGRRTATRIARNPPTIQGFKWAIASRVEDQKLLEDLLKEIQSTHAPNSGVSIPEIIIANAKSHDELLNFTKRAKVVINAVGPFRYFGLNVATACVEGRADYVDCCGEPEFYDRVFLNCNKAARENGVTIVHASGWDSVPADLGVLACKLEFAKRGGVCNAVEMFHSLQYGPLGFALNYATYESAVQGFAHRKELGKLRKALSGVRPNLPRLGEKLKINSTPGHFDKRIGLACMVFPGSDASCVKMGQQVVQMNREAGSASQALAGIPAVEFSAYLAAWTRTVYQVVGYAAFDSILASYTWGRKLLLDYPYLFTQGIFSKTRPPNEKMIHDTSFTSTFLANGYSDPAAVKTAGKVNKPNMFVKMSVTGPEPAYVFTPIALACSAYTLLEQKSSIPAGVNSPASAFADTAIFDRFRGFGIKWSIHEVKTTHVPETFVGARL
ncbi:hypothetical protein SmJEL517_g05814 [Synchytrium microbalum]|uniref:Saccharopine dehydrogenase NADP binding domain-containing protein n=1 Tax=Synchytrium microbalum TaxID=1806994 RepID=A0A507BTV4_9FUNG|nr:uncharacterized protein SmJEL517_g05814 [Synchytrium microbalum]TPX30681.1 hypothetical protein SmJEL517_g05814 [Synchytrium microbalum]